MTPETVEKFRRRLEREAAELKAAEVGTAGDRAPVALDQQSVGRLSRMDAMQQQAMAAAQARRRQARLRAIAGTLRRMDEDEFGWCESCGEPIAEGRLEIDPCAPRCVACAGG